MSENEKLVERLRGVDHMSVEDCFLQSHLFAEAAAALTAAEARIKILEATARNRVSERHEDLMVEALAEIKASIDGHSDQTVRDIIYGLIAEINALPDHRALTGASDAG